MDNPKSRVDVPGSFRDPSGFLFWQDGEIYRQVNIACKADYDHLLNSGLYDALIKADYLIPHCETGIEAPIPELSYKVIKPEMIPFISYPYEWCFSQLKDAALLTLWIQRLALDFGMSLKDCSAYNIQFRKGKPVFIDTLSFEEYCEGQPWGAFGQFCQHFLAPLSLMSHKDVRLSQLLRVYIDGMPLDLASSLLPWRTWLMLPLLFHIHLHARSQKHFAVRTLGNRQYNVSRFGLLGILGGLEAAVKKLRWCPAGTEWAEYYEDTNYSAEGLQHKKQIVSQFLNRVNTTNVWDFGANIGMFSRLASDNGISTISFDIDPAAVEKNYLRCVKEGNTHILPLVANLTNPTSGIGWENEERMSLLERGPADCVLALALVHHFALANNLPLGKIADFFSKCCCWLIIEFVPKTDSQVQRMLSAREDIFVDYTRLCFEREFGKYFSLLAYAEIRDSERILYLMKRKQT